MTESCLLNGIKCYFRLLTISDKEIYLDAFNRLSMTSKKHRFHQPKKSLSKKDIQYFLNINNHDHLAIGATIKIKNKEYGVGLIRYIRQKDNAKCAEVGLAVIDSFQHNGLGTELYKKLLKQARKHGIKKLSNHVLNENNLMIQLLNKFNGKAKQQCDGTRIITVKTMA